MKTKIIRKNQNTIQGVKQFIIFEGMEGVFWNFKINLEYQYN